MTLLYDLVIEQRWLERFLSFHISVCVGVSLPGVMIGVYLDEPLIWFPSLIVLYVGMISVRARWLAHQGLLDQAAALFAYTTLIGSPLGTLIVPPAVVPMALNPALGLVIALPLLHGRRLTWLFVGTVLTTIAVPLAALISPISQPSWPQQHLFNLAITASSIWLLALRLWQYRNNLERLFSSMAEAGRALEHARDSLERQVELRTATLREREADLRQIYGALQSSEARYRMLAEHATDIIALFDNQGVCRYCSPAVRCILGFEPHELMGAPSIELVHPDDQSAVSAAFMQLSERETTTFTCRLRCRDGTYRWVEAASQSVRAAAGAEPQEIVSVMRDIDARKAYEAQIERLAYFDPLTALANRRGFYLTLEQVLRDAAQRGGRVGLLYLDLDRFKTVNDSLGHDAGDELLVQVAQRLRAHVGPGDTLARLGGDEFAIVLAELFNNEQAAQMAQATLSQITRPFELRGHIVHLGVSIGIACTPEAGLEAEALIKHADISMYRAKGEGDAYTFYDPALSQLMEERLLLESELRQALAADQLMLYYQPIYALESGSLLGVEALVRWNHPSRGLVLPGSFIPLAEESGLIRLLDRWVIRTALRQLASWVDDGWPIKMSINLSVRSLHERDLGEEIIACLADTGAPAELVTIEVTESAAMRDPEAILLVLRRLRELGISLALDDFGSGHASLTYLKRLPVDTVKIDRAFIQGVGQDARDEGVVRAIVALSQALGIMVVAEGVRDPDQGELLCALGCDMGQGFGLGRPAPPEALLAAERWKSLGGM